MNTIYSDFVTMTFALPELLAFVDECFERFGSDGAHLARYQPWVTT